MTESAVALDTVALSAWIRAEDAVQARLVGELPALPSLVLAEAAHGWLLEVRKAEQQGREDRLGRALERLTSATFST